MSTNIMVKKNLLMQGKVEFPLKNKNQEILVSCVNHKGTL